MKRYGLHIRPTVNPATNRADWTFRIIDTALNQTGAAPWIACVACSRLTYRDFAGAWQAAQDAMAQFLLSKHPDPPQLAHTAAGPDNL